MRKLRLTEVKWLVHSQAESGFELKFLDSTQQEKSTDLDFNNYWNTAFALFSKLDLDISWPPFLTKSKTVTIVMCKSNFPEKWKSTLPFINVTYGSSARAVSWASRTLGSGASPTIPLTCILPSSLGVHRALCHPQRSGWPEWQCWPQFRQFCLIPCGKWPDSSCVSFCPVSIIRKHW